MNLLPLFKSLALHSLLFGALFLGLVHEAPGVKGTDGLAGAPTAHFEVTVTSPPAAAPERAKLKAPVREGLAIKESVSAELPSDIKNPEPRVIDEPPTSSEGRSADAPNGIIGQAGSSATASALLGDGERTNRFGVYLRDLQKRIQSHLGRAPLLDFDRRTRLAVTIRKDGTTTIVLKQSSGDRELDRLALRAAEDSRPLPVWEEDLTVEVPVLFRAH